MSKVKALLELVQRRDDVATVRKLLLKLATKGSFSSEGRSNWTKARLGDLGKWGSGGTPLRSQGNYYAGGTIPWLVIGDLNDAIVTKAATFITPEGLENSSASLLPENTLLIAMYGSIGKMGITGIQCATNQAIAHCKPDPEKVILWYLFYALKSIQDDLLGRGQGLAQKNISQTILKAWTIPLPPLAEQKRIVAKVDELMALCDRLEAQLKERDVKQAAIARAALAKFTENPSQENLQLLFHPSFTVEPEDMRKAVLTLAINGRLTCNNPGTTTATASFPIVPLGSLLTDGPTNGVSPKAVSHDTGVKSLSLSATTSGVFKGEHFKFVPLKVPADSNLWLKDGDLLIQRSNSLEKVGTSAIYRGKPNQFIYPDLMMKMRLSELADVDFVQLVLCEQGVRQYFRGKAVGTSGNMPKIGQETVRNTPIPLPNLDVQRAIVEKVKRLDSMIDQLESQLEASRTTGEKLLEAMVAELTSA